MVYMFLEIYKSLHIIFPFLVSGEVKRYKEERISECGPPLVHSIFTILIKPENQK